MNFFFRDACLVFPGLTEKLEHAFGGNGKKLHKGTHHDGKELQRTRDTAGNGFGIDLSQALGNQFTEHNGEVSDKHHHRHDADEF